MADRYTEIVLLAHEIEWIHAQDRCRLRGFKGRGGAERRRQAVAAEFDPLAATCLADLIEARLFTAAPSNGEDQDHG